MRQAIQSPGQFIVLKLPRSANLFKKQRGPFYCFAKALVDYMAQHSPIIIESPKLGKIHLITASGQKPLERDVAGESLVSALWEAR
jgi:hypothetical protein